MANTKHLDRKERKKVKRRMRHQLKKQLAGLTLKERKELKQFEGTVTQFLRAREEKKKQAQQAAEAEGTEAAEDTAAQ